MRCASASSDGRGSQRAQPQGGRAATASSVARETPSHRHPPCAEHGASRVVLQHPREHRHVAARFEGHGTRGPFATAARTTAGARVPPSRPTAHPRRVHHAVLQRRARRASAQRRQSHARHDFRHSATPLPARRGRGTAPRVRRAPRVARGCALRRRRCRRRASPRRAVVTSPRCSRHAQQRRRHWRADAVQDLATLSTVRSGRHNRHGVRGRTATVTSTRSTPHAAQATAFDLSHGVTARPPAPVSAVNRGTPFARPTPPARLPGPSGQQRASSPRTRDQGDRGSVALRAAARSPGRPNAAATRCRHAVFVASARSPRERRQSCARAPSDARRRTRPPRGGPRDHHPERVRPASCRESGRTATPR